MLSAKEDETGRGSRSEATRGDREEKEQKGAGNRPAHGSLVRSVLEKERGGEGEEGGEEEEKTVRTGANEGGRTARGRNVRNNIESKLLGGIFFNIK